jgi:hypothetical protein
MTDGGGGKETLWPMLHKLSVSLKAVDRELSAGKALMKRVMQAWLPASAALLEMIVFHLPSPAKAQQYRVETLYEGFSRGRAPPAAPTSDCRRPSPPAARRCFSRSRRTRVRPARAAVAGWCSRPPAQPPTPETIAS